MTRCETCGANLALVGRVHNCRPRVTPVTPVTNVTPDPVTPVTKRPYPVTNVTPPVTLVTKTLEQERDRLLVRLAEIRAELGSMTPAERQRRRRRGNAAG